VGGNWIGGFWGGLGLGATAGTAGGVRGSVIACFLWIARYDWGGVSLSKLFSACSLLLVTACSHMVVPVAIHSPVSKILDRLFDGSTNELV
jgi:hypothetical protein